MDLVTALEETFSHARGVVGNVRPEQHTEKTPCTEWTVRDLLAHMVGVVAMIGDAAAGRPASPFELADDPAAQFAGAADAALDAWRQPGVLERAVDAGPGPMPGRALASINLLDTATHTWDLAIATGQPAELPEPVAEAAMEASRSIVTDELRISRFADEQPAAAGTSSTERLVAFLGRSA